MTHDDTSADKALLSDALVREIAPILADKGSGVQAAALAELTAIWLANVLFFELVEPHENTGHIILVDRDATAVMRQKLFELHCAAIWELVELCDRERANKSG